MREYIYNILKEIDSNSDLFNCDIIDNSLKMILFLKRKLEEIRQ